MKPCSLKTKGIAFRMSLKSKPSSAEAILGTREENGKIVISVVSPDGYIEICLDDVQAEFLHGRIERYLGYNTGKDVI